MNVLLSREAMIAFALVGGGVSLVAILLQRRGTINGTRLKQLNGLAYALMAISMVIFIIVGIRGPRS